VAALYDAEKRAALAGAAFESALAALGPTQRQLHRPGDFVACRRQLEAFVELHGDICAEQYLDLDRPLGRELNHRSVDVRAEPYGVLLDLAEVGERHDLEPAGVGQDRQRPVHELVQTAERGDSLRAWAEHEVISVAEHDLGPGPAHIVR